MVEESFGLLSSFPYEEFHLDFAKEPEGPRREGGWYIDTTELNTYSIKHTPQ